MPLTLRDLGGFNLKTSLAIMTLTWKVKPLDLTLVAILLSHIYIDYINMIIFSKCPCFVDLYNAHLIFKILDGSVVLRNGITSLVLILISRMHELVS